MDGRDSSKTGEADSVFKTESASDLAIRRAR